MPPNCSLLEVVPIFEGVGQPIDTIFMGTYDGNLLAYRFQTSDLNSMDGSTENLKQQMNLVKKWTLNGYILSLIHFGIQNTATQQEESK